MKLRNLLLAATAICPMNIALGDNHFLEGTYRCKNQRGLPENTYSVRSLMLDGAKIPYIEATRYFRRDPANPNSPIAEAKISGLAAVSSVESSTTLMVAAIQLEFRDRKLVGCDQQP